MTDRNEYVHGVQQKYAKRLKARLSEPTIDPVTARDGVLDCFVATYFGGVKQGIAGYLGIDASEEQVAHIAQSMFRRKLKNHGSDFDSPSIEALDRVKQEVDDELHFEELPAELGAMHNQVCTLLLSKAEGGLDHAGDTSAVKAAKEAKEAKPKEAAPQAVSGTSEQSEHRSAPRTPVEKPAPSAALNRRPLPPRAAPAVSVTGPTESSPVPSRSLEAGLRALIAEQLPALAEATRSGVSKAVLRSQLEKLLALVSTLED